MKVLNNIFFHLMERFRVLTQDDHMRKRRTTEERRYEGVRGWKIPLSLQSAEVLSGKIACKHVLRTGHIPPSRPPSFHYPRCAQRNFG